MDLTRMKLLRDLSYYIMRNTMTHTGHEVLFGKPNKGSEIGQTAIRKVQKHTSHNVKKHRSYITITKELDLEVNTEKFR
jgi:hypothetical protein